MHVYPLRYRRNAIGISPRSQRNIAEKPTEYRRKAIGISPRSHCRCAKQSMTMRFHDGFKPIWLFFYSFGENGGYTPTKNGDIRSLLCA